MQSILKNKVKPGIYGYVDGWIISLSFAIFDSKFRLIERLNFFTLFCSLYKHLML